MNKQFKCPFCDKTYVQKPSLYTHMEEKHYSQLNGLPPAQIYFNVRNKKTCGHCIVCGHETKFSLQSEKYERICSDKCKEKYVEIFRKRMLKKYNKEHLLNDPDMQKKMLANRKISGKYKWKDGTEFQYTGTYEEEFLEFMDVFMNWNSNDIIAPSPEVFEYNFKGKKHFYIPDVYIPSLDLYIEIKSFDNKHYRQRDLEQEKYKDKAVIKANHNFFKVHDKDYDDFFEFIINLK